MFPKGDTPQKAQDFYEYLQGHHETQNRVVTWDVDWTSLAWMWGFVFVLVLVLLLWVMQYRTTRQRTGIYPVDRSAAGHRKPPGLRRSSSWYSPP